MILAAGDQLPGDVILAHTRPGQTAAVITGDEEAQLHLHWVLVHVYYHGNIPIVTRTPEKHFM